MNQIDDHDWRARFDDAHEAAYILFKALGPTVEHAQSDTLHRRVTDVYPHTVPVSTNGAIDVILACEAYFGRGGVFWRGKLNVKPEKNFQPARWIVIVRQDPLRSPILSSVEVKIFFHFVHPDDAFEFKLRFYQGPSV